MYLMVSSSYTPKLLDVLNGFQQFSWTPQEHEEEASETTEMGSKESREESGGEGAEEEGNRMETKVMTCCHYIIFRTYFDNLIEFWGNMRWLEVLKARKSEELKATNRVTIFTTETRFYHQRRMLFEPPKSWYDFWWRVTIMQNRGAILWTVVRFRCVQNCLFKLKSVPNTRVTIFGDLKCDFETWRLF